MGDQHPFKNEYTESTTRVERQLYKDGNNLYEFKDEIEEYGLIDPVYSPSNIYSSTKVNSPNCYEGLIKQPDASSSAYDKSMSCDQCEYTTSDKSNLRRHIKTKHATIKEFNCNDCDYATNRKDNLLTHLKSSHKKLSCK